MRIGVLDIEARKTWAVPWKLPKTVDGIFNSSTARSSTSGEELKMQIGRANVCAPPLPGALPILAIEARKTWAVPWKLPKTVDGIFNSSTARSTTSVEELKM